MPKKSPVHLITFDIDGTLTDSTDFDSELYLQAIDDVLNIKIDDDWNRFNHVTDSGILDQVIVENDLYPSRDDIHSQVHRCFVNLTRKYLSDYPDEITEIPGAKKLIETLLSKRNVSVAIATGGWEETAKMKLNAIGIHSGRLPLASASDSYSRIDIMRIAEKRALKGRTASQKIYIGDGLWDQQASRQLGYRFIAVGGSVEHHTRVPDFNDIDTILAMLCLDIPPLPRIKKASK